MEWVQFGFSAAFIIVGLFVFIVGIIGIYQFKFVLNRMHAAGMLDTMGIFFIVVGIAIKNGIDATTIKLFIIVLTLWLTSPIASHFIAKLEYVTDESLNDEIENELSEIKKGDDNDVGSI